MIRVLFVLLCVVVRGLASQVAVETQPARPVRGSLIRLRIIPIVSDSTAEVTEVLGEVEGEPLHLQTSDSITWTGLAGIPVEGNDSLPLVLVLRRGGVEDTIRQSLAVLQPNYSAERLRVAPRMAEPDSAARVKIDQDIARAREVGRATHDSERLWNGPFLLPRPTRITSTFGTGREFNGRVTSRHLGTDFSGAVGAPVRATNRGRVALVADFYLAGKVVYLDHGQGLVSAYFHLSRAGVKPGELVDRGQIIGAVGQSGRVTGPHLHWVMRYGNTTVDPMSVVEVMRGE